MRRLKHFKWAAALALALALAPLAASAQEADTLSISGTFRPDLLYLGPVGDDLAQVYADGGDYGWTLTLYGVTYAHEEITDEFSDEDLDGILVARFTRVYAPSSDLEFFGPHAEILNQVFSTQLSEGSLELLTIDYFYSTGGDFQYSEFRMQLAPMMTGEGVYFGAFTDNVVFGRDENEFPLLAPMRIEGFLPAIGDLRPGYNGYLLCERGLIDIGSSVPPPPPPPPPEPAPEPEPEPEPPPPPPLPMLTIEDGSVREGNRGTTWLDLTVSLSRYPDDVVTVDFQTADGTASKKSDYTATSGTLLFWPDELSHTISIAIKADRKREPNETFYVDLFDPVGATIADGEATATILNDD